MAQTLDSDTFSQKTNKCKGHTDVQVFLVSQVCRFVQDSSFFFLQKFSKKKKEKKKKKKKKRMFQSSLYLCFS